MADIMLKMISSAQLDLQNEERELCIALNTLALLQGLRVTALCDTPELVNNVAGAANADGAHRWFCFQT